MNIEHIANIKPGQDGAIWNNYLFRFDDQGNCFVYDIKNLKESNETLKEFDWFVLDKAQIIVPHCNSVVFGNEYYDKNDEFPLLYCNIYNNYANSDDKLKGTCCVYRITRNRNTFSSQLVQIIKIGFVENETLWKSENREDVRPYGNFVIDREQGLYHAFTMIDTPYITRYFSFKLPKISDGTYYKKYGVNIVILTENDIENSFDCEYHRYIQGACTNKGKIYSLEGFYHGNENEPVLRIINPTTKKQELCVEFSSLGLVNEPEFIDFKDETCYYGDGSGNLYIIEF